MLYQVVRGLQTPLMGAKLFAAGTANYSTALMMEMQMKKSVK